MWLQNLLLTKPFLPPHAHSGQQRSRTSLSASIPHMPRLVPDHLSVLFLSLRGPSSYRSDFSGTRRPYYLLFGAPPNPQILAQPPGQLVGGGAQRSRFQRLFVRRLNISNVIVVDFAIVRLDAVEFQGNSSFYRRHPVFEILVFGFGYSHVIGFVLFGFGLFGCHCQFFFGVRARISFLFPGKSLIILERDCVLRRIEADLKLAALLTADHRRSRSDLGPKLFLLVLDVMESSSFKLFMLRLLMYQCIFFSLVLDNVDRWFSAF